MAVSENVAQAATARCNPEPRGRQQRPTAMIFMVDSHHSITVAAPAGRSPRIFSTHLQWIQPVAESRSAPGIAINHDDCRRKDRLKPALDRHSEFSQVDGTEATKSNSTNR